uniref:Uncharacterized protein n=1 Tax=Myoviridae sp. ctCo31 TaxID=2825053 RepID=A0A8S5UMH4_9CAUD|nr:MAG TPA: hypothetical protein [Myoviridae sp. ctCo31]
MLFYSKAQHHSQKYILLTVLRYEYSLIFL